MAGRGPQSFQKRQKEQKRKEKQEEKRAKRIQRRSEKGSGLPEIAGPDSDDNDNGEGLDEESSEEETANTVGA